MNVQDAANLTIPEGNVRNIHDKDKRLLWSAVGYDVKYKGDTTQQTYSGKNLFNVNATPTTLRHSTATVDGQSITVITNDSSNTARVDYSLPYEANKTMTLSYDYEVLANNTTLGSAIVYLRSPTDSASDTILETSFSLTVGNKGYKTVTLQGGTPDTTKRLWLYVKTSPVSGVVSVKFSNIQLEYAGSETSYEPYVGGIPAPNPDYPQDVNVVQGAQSVKITGKNRISIPSGTKTENGITWTREDGVVHGSGTFETYTYSNFVGTTTLSLPAGDYTFSIKEALPSPLMVEFSTRDNSNVRKNYQIPSGQTSITKSFPNGLSWTGVALVGGTVGQEIDVTIKNIQIEPGSTATSYEPYQGQTFPVGLIGKNLFNINTLSDGWLNISGNINADSSWKHTNYIPIQPSTAYTTSGFVNGSGVNPARCYYDANKVFISGVKHNNTEPFTDISPSNARYMIECCRTVDINTLQIELGPTATPYVPYYNYELCKIGNYKDYIYKGADGWYVHKETGKHTFTGSEGWGAQSNYDSANRKLFGFNALNSINGDDVSSRLGVCSEFSYVTGLQNSSVDVTGFQFNTGASYSKWVYVKIEKDLLPTQDAQGFKNWLSNHNMTIYYQMSPAIDTQITDNTLISQLNAIHDWLRRYDYYGIVSGNLPIIINRSGII